jgi:hypothetical protein
VLLQLLDHPQNDIYLHIDKSARGWDAAALQASVRRGTLSIQSKFRPAWGSEALVDATLALLRTASATPHAYYHLLSGMDLPLRSQDEIHAFFAKADHAEFVDFKSETVSPDLLQNRLQTFHFLQSTRQRSPLLRRLDDLSLRLQSLLKINRLKYCAVRFQKGSQWFSITQAFAEYCLAHAAEYRRYFRFSKCADELFVQTLLQNSPFLANRFSGKFDDEYATMRLIDWDRGTSSSPYVFRATDYDAIQQSGMLFARKFDERVDAEIIRRIAQAVAAS